MVELKITLPDKFLDEEERCGYTVSYEMKEIWAVELDLLSELMRVCRNYNLTIFASGGTMLGAVRHQGFIPWDDDIDMAMFRKDYERLCEIADKEFTYPYFFQTEYNDPGSLRGHAQLRNSLTTGILESEKGIGHFNQGIFIDIFPADNVVDDEHALKKQEVIVKKYADKMKRYARCSTRFRNEKKGIKGVIKRFINSNFYSYCEKKEKMIYKKFEHACQTYNDTETKGFSLLSFQFSNLQHYQYYADYKELVVIPFEFLEIPVAVDYDHALTIRYGNYHEFVMGGNLHGSVIFDVNKSYKEYCN